MELIMETHQKAISIHQEVIEIRQHIHAHPELSFEEIETSRFIQCKLDQYGIDYTTGWAGTGIIGEIKAQNAVQTIVFRADMDALPILEQNQVDYCSTNEGVMHACGHDVHTACLLGALKIIQQLKDRLKVNIKFVFQPGEEKFPGGASMIISEGGIKNIDAQGIIALHVDPSLEVGKVGFRSGPYMASTDEIYINVKGKGGHGAMPHLTIDPVYISSQIINGLQAVISRNKNPIEPSVLSFGKINSVGGATNVIPDQVNIEGTFRAMNETWRQCAHDLILNIATSIASAHGGVAEVRIEKGYPVLVNDDHLTTYCNARAIDFLGSENVVQLPLRMTAEDFSYYTQIMPGCFFRLGVANNKKGINAPVHTATFDIDPAALITGPALLAYFALNFDESVMLA